MLEENLMRKRNGPDLLVHSMVFKRVRVAEVEVEAKVGVTQGLALDHILRGGEEVGVVLHPTALDLAATREAAVIPLHNGINEAHLTLAGQKSKNMMISVNISTIPTNAEDLTAGATVKVCRDLEADPESV